MGCFESLEIWEAIYSTISPGLKVAGLLMLFDLENIPVGLQSWKSHTGWELVYYQSDLS